MCGKAPYVITGASGQPGRTILKRGKGDERIIADLTPVGAWAMSLFSNFRIHDGDADSAECGGGGGWGDPLERDPRRVLDYVLEGFSSPEKARGEYGVELTVEGDGVDAEATQALRRRMTERA